MAFGVCLCCVADISGDGLFDGLKEASENLAGTQLFEERCLEMFLESCRPVRQARERKEHKREKEFGEVSFGLLGRGCSSVGAC